MRSISSLNLGSRGDLDQLFYEPLFDNLEDHIWKLSRAEAGNISAYMEIFRDKETVWLSYPTDPLNENVVVDRNGGEDGQYRWAGITHYLIEEYCVDPPMEFRRHVQLQLSSGVDLQELAVELSRPKKRRSSKLLREREWRERKAKSGVALAWALYP